MFRSLNAESLFVSLLTTITSKPVFNDVNATADKLNIEVGHKAFAWTTQGHQKYIIVEYTVRNQSGAALSDMYAGIYGDWDVADAANNNCATSASRQMGYTYDLSVGGVYAGVQLLTDDGFIHHAMLNNSPPGINPNTSYTSAQKYTSMSTSVASVGGEDVSNVVSTGPFNLADGDSVTVAFALIAGDDLADLESSADSAYAQYNDKTLPATGVETIAGNSAKLDVYPNPSNGRTNVSFYNVKNQHVDLSVYDVTGKIVKSLIAEPLAQGNHNFSFDLSKLDSGVYFYEFNTGGQIATKKVMLY